MRSYNKSDKITHDEIIPLRRVLFQMIIANWVSDNDDGIILTESFCWSIDSSIEYEFGIIGLMYALFKSIQNE